MSQQNPGQPGGYGGGPPGYGGGPPGYGGGPPGYGGGPPGYGGGPPGPPAGGPPPGGMPYPGPTPAYPGGPQQPVAPPTGNKRQLWLAAGLGCGFLLLLAIGGTLGLLFWLRNRGNAFVEDVQRQLGSSTVVPAGTATPVTAPGNEAAPGTELTADCKVAYGCCRAIAAKSTGNAAAVQACEAFKTAGYPQASCAASLTAYRQVAKAIGVACE